MRSLVAAAESHNPILPESSELIYGVFAFAVLVVPLLIVAFIVRQVVMTRRAAERAADAAERAANR